MPSIVGAFSRVLVLVLSALTLVLFAMVELIAQIQAPMKILSCVAVSRRLHPSVYQPQFQLLHPKQHGPQLPRRRSQPDLQRLSQLWALQSSHLRFLLKFLSPYHHQVQHRPLLPHLRVPVNSIVGEGNV